MKVGDKIKVIKDNHSIMEDFVGLIGEVVVVTDDSLGLNIGVLFKQEDNKEYLHKFSMIGNKILHFDIDEIEVITK